MPAPNSANFYSELEARQLEALRMLDELDRQILAVLEEFSPKPDAPLGVVPLPPMHLPDQVRMMN